MQEIADAAGVSHMTFFRHFPTKEAVVAADDYDPMLAELIAARPAGEPVIETVRHAVAAGLLRIYATDRDLLLSRSKLMLSAPSLRAAAMENQIATQELILAALEQRDGIDPRPSHPRPRRREPRRPHHRRSWRGSKATAKPNCPR